MKTEVGKVERNVYYEVVLSDVLFTLFILYKVNVNIRGLNLSDIMVDILIKLGLRRPSKSLIGKMI